ncbi:MAG: acetyl-CoA C-acyltransferase [Cyclobacteriaceae bacterium]|jgi:acetyl-CoA C-acetyltransferase|nr:acetyl-CoA C-acyltransferase [Cyclobacteriaceae bacterium]
MHKSAFITTILRTPVGKYGGALAAVRPDDLLAHALRAVIRANPTLEVSQIEEVIAGAANQSGEDNRNVARMAALLAGLPVEVAGVTVNRLCASGLQAIIDCARGVLTGQGHVYLAAGVESMSRAPFVMAKSEEPFSRKAEVYDTTLGWRFTNPALAKLYYPYGMGETAENVAAQWNISRTAQDEFGLASQQKYFQAAAQHRFKEEIIPVPVPRGKELTLFDTDEYPRQTSLEKLAALKPAFREGGTVTAGNSSGINDGAAAALVASEEAVKNFQLKPLVRVAAMAVAGVDPAYMGVGPVPAVKKALQRAGLTIQDLGLVELNEAFAAQAIACIRDLDLNPALVNVNGGAIAIGHPLGCSGVRISATLIHEMQKRNVKYGLATMCVGVGQGVAVIYENVGTEKIGR